MNRHIWGFSMVLLVGCTTPMSALRDENHQLTRTVEELRTDRRAQDRKLKDLQHQLDKLRGDKVSAVLASRPQLRVEVAGPAASGPSSQNSPSDAPRIFAISDDGTEIVYEGDAALGKAATVEDDVTPVGQPTPHRARPSTVPVGSYAAS